MELLVRDMMDVAYHEAGHAVTAHLLGRNIRYAKLNGTFETVIEDRADDFLGHLRTIFGGLVTETIRGKIFINPSRMVEEAEIRRYLPKCSADYDTERKFVKRLLQDNWDLVDKIARALFTRGCLTGSEIREIDGK